MFQIRHELLNRDLLWTPTSYNLYSTCNYYQLSSLRITEREPIMSIISYLFDKSEPYELSEDEKNDRKMFYTKLRNKYTCAKQYLLRVKTMLFSNPEVDCWTELIQKKVFSKK